MKIAITGHTKGIGEAIASLFPDPMGFSRSNGYDITSRIDRNRIYSEIHDCDVFVNNAMQDFAQTELLFELWEQWRSKNKMIVNIGSVSSNYVYGRLPHINYSVQKAALDHASTLMAMAHFPCKVTNIKPAFVNDSGISAILVTDLAHQIKELITMKASFWVPSITMHVGK